MLRRAAPLTATRNAADSVRSEGRTKFPVADSLRAIAIFSVVLYHLIWQGRPLFRGHVLTLAYFGVWGVNCFFVLTGFLLAKPFVRSLTSNSPLPNIPRFFVRRFYRIYPAYFVAIVASSIVAYVYAEVRPTFVDVGSHLMMLQSYSPKTVFSLNSPLWTMGIDAVFYVCLPVITFVLRPMMTRIPLSGRTSALLTLLLAVVISSGWYRYHQYASHPKAIFDYAESTVFVRNLLGMATAFALGIGVEIATTSTTAARRPYYIALALLGTLIAAVQLVLQLEVNRAATPTAFARMALVDPLAAASSALILYGLVQLESKSLKRIVESRFTQLISALSYSIYLVHMPIIAAIKRAIVTAHVPTGNLFVLLGVLSLPIVGLVAFVLYRVVEQPFLRIKKNFGDAY